MLIFIARISDACLFPYASLSVTQSNVKVHGGSVQKMLDCLGDG